MTDPFAPYRDSAWDLPGLAAAARDLLQKTGVRPEDERVNALPDERTVRYYQTGGLVDRPLRYEGRTALYGFRHLLQVVAVKLLQAQGSSLAQVQRALAGTSTAALEEAVRTSLGAPASPARGPASRSLVAAEIAPGVTVLVDPAVVGDPGEVLSRLSDALSPLGGVR
ncbi:MAG TPA: MerR family transcriptional regulator [Thermoanaerobaculia bacterium]|nr:MerR family transcriptional regulator [Thermoanaerobaculia bacterium]